jgi:hypothetical protein
VVSGNKLVIACKRVLISLVFASQAVTPDNFLFGCSQTGDDIQRDLKQSKNARPVNIVGNDGVTYPSVVSQPIPHGETWDSTEEDIEYAEIYLSNFAYGM